MKKPSSTFIGTLAAVLGVVALVLGLVAKHLVFDPISVSDTQPVTLVVNKGESTTSIGAKLAELQLVRHPLIFRLVVKQQGLAGKLQAGSFKLRKSMTPIEIAHALTQGTEDVWVTILEGWRKEEIAEYLAAQELPAFDKQDFLLRATELEGTLFPDTYLVPREITAVGMIKLLTDTFAQKVSTDLAEDIATFTADTGYSRDDALVLASLVQREARTYEQMRHVAGILLHRLDIGMALQVDATLQYVKGYNNSEQTWWSPPLAADKTLTSAYNTYLHPGLPPGPIANPGLEAIRATLNPVKTDELFYLHASDGTMYYAKTFEEHTANVSRYLR